MLLICKLLLRNSTLKFVFHFQNNPKDLNPSYKTDLDLWNCFGREKLSRSLTNPLSGCPGQVKIFTGQVKYFLTCPEKCISYIKLIKELQHLVVEVLYRTSRSNSDLSVPVSYNERSTYATIFKKLDPHQTASGSLDHLRGLFSALLYYFLNIPSPIHWNIRYIQTNQSQWLAIIIIGPGRVAQSVGHLTRKSGVLG